MRAVILAAGEGSRIRPHFTEPKPLIKLLGLSLLERSILSLRECGINDFVIITGYARNEIIDYLGEGSKNKIHITYLHNPNWKQGNGVSAAAFKKIHRPGEKFILTMADHVFNPEVLKTFVQAAASIGHDELLLAADKRLDRVWDLHECTKIKSAGDKAIKLSKTLHDYNAVDCGIFIGTEVLLQALEEAVSGQSYNLTDAVNILASQGKVKLHYIKADWVDVDDPASFRQAEKILLKSALPDKDGLVSRTVNRKFSLPASKILCNTAITPNQVTLISFLTALAAALSFALHQPALGGILAQISSVIDGIDGEIARLKFLKSNYGSLFDAILDRYADFFIVTGMAWDWFAKAGNLAVLLVTAAALTGLPLSMLLKEKYHSITGKAYLPRQDDGLLKFLPANRDGRLFIIMLGGIFNMTPAALVILAVITHFQALGRLAKLRKLL
jgi:CDP-L-myo-inositol myo-inositolphosphotransferase